MTSDDRWIELDGASNARDVGGLPTVDGSTVRPGRLLRSDSLQELTPADVRHLVDDLGVRSIADLRSGVEVRGEGPGPMTAESGVMIHHLSLFGETSQTPPTEPGAESTGPVVLPWQARESTLTDDERRRGAAAVYLRYLGDRPDSLLTALRLIGSTDGATLIHCAAGKDRTGVVVAFALAEVGVTREAIIADYALSAERITAIIDRLSARDTYRSDLGVADSAAKHAPQADTMRNLLAEMDARFGGVPAWLRANGWTEDDASALRSALLGD